MCLPLLRGDLCLGLIMNLLLWNARGAGNKGFMNSVRDLIRHHKVDLLVILEPRISGSKADIVISHLGIVIMLKLMPRAFLGAFGLCGAGMLLM